MLDAEVLLAVVTVVPYCFVSFDIRLDSLESTLALFKSWGKAGNGRDDVVAAAVVSAKVSVSPDVDGVALVEF